MASTGYSRTQIRLHWAVMVLVVLQFAFHDGISDAFEDGLETGALALSAPVIGHMAGGGLILLLTVWRVLLRRERGAPPPPEGEPAWQKRIAEITHRAIYTVLLLLPLSGAVAWGSASAAAGDVHELLKSALLALVLLHVAGALYGQFVQGTGVIGRMMRARD